MAHTIPLLATAGLGALLILAALAQTECPDCGGTTRALAEEPSRRIGGPAILECPRCDDRGRVPRWNLAVGRTPHPLIAGLMRHSNQETWRSSDIRDRLNAQLRSAGLDPSPGSPWGDSDGQFGRSRFISSDGRVFVLLLLEAGEWYDSEHAPVRVLLFGEDGTPLDALRLAVEGGREIPHAEFDGRGVRIRLKSSATAPFRRVQIAHGERRPERPGASLDQDWRVDVLDGRLHLAERR